MMPDHDNRKKAWALSSETRMGVVLARVPVDLAQVMQRSEGAVMHATLLCTSCKKNGICEEWTAAHPEGEGSAPPEFCPNGAFLRSLAPKAE